MEVEEEEEEEDGAATSSAPALRWRRGERSAAVSGSPAAMARDEDGGFRRHRAEAL